MSDEALVFVNTVISLILRAEKAEAPIRKTKKLFGTVGALVADLLKVAWIDKTRYSYRSLAAGSFSGERFGYSAFRRAVSGMEAAGLLTIILGEGGGTSKGWATRFRARPKLLRIAKAHGLWSADWSDHFRFLPRPRIIPNPLVLKKNAKGYGAKKAGGIIPIDLSRSPAMELADEVNRLNAFFADVLIEPADSHFGFRRVFNQGDLPGFDWNKGGRLISLGISYQQMKPDERKRMKLNGKPVVEIDVRASHLTILHSLLKLPFDASGSDPYEHPEIPRKIVKAWVTMTLGYDKFQKRWSNENKGKFREESKGDLQKEYPIIATREKLLDLLPVLRSWPECAVRWGDLQYLESQAIVCAVGALAFKHNIPALPVHDSIIVPASAEERAKQVLSDCFQRIIGVRPALSVK